jgi:transposase-like protein
MAKAYSMDLRERVVEAVERDGLSRNQAAARFEVAISTAIDWVNRYRETAAWRPGRSAGIGRRSLLVSIGSGCCGDAGSARSPCAGWSANWPSAA